MKKFIAVFAILCCFLSTTMKAQEHSLKTSFSIQENLQLLEQHKKLLYIGLMPGSENSFLLTAMRKRYHFSTAFLMLTRGERQLNYSGVEQGIDLGIIHGQEMLAAGKIAGFSLFATSYMDIGTTDSAIIFQVWNKKRLLSDIASVIRTYRPDIIISGRLNNQDSAGSWLQNICLEANRLATLQDDHAFKGTDSFGTAFGAKWVLTEIFPPGGQKLAQETATLLKIPMNGYDTASGTSFCKIATASKQAERSLYADLDNIPLGADTQYLKLISKDGLPDNELPDIDNPNTCGGWARTPDGTALHNLFFELLQKYRGQDADFLAQTAQLYQKLNAKDQDNPDIRSLTKEVKNLLIASTGLKVDATTDRDLGVLGQDFNLQINIDNPLTALHVDRVKIEGLMDTSFTQDEGTLQVNQGMHFKKKLHIALFQEAYQPFWLNKQVNADMSYNIDPQMQGRLTDTACYQAKIVLSLQGLTLDLTVPVLYEHFDRFEGEQQRAFYTIEPLLVMQTPDVLLTQIEGDTKAYKKPEITFRLKTLFQDSSMLAILKIRQVGLEGTLDGQLIKTGAAEDIYKNPTYLTPIYNQSVHINLPYEEIFAKKWRLQTPVLKPEVLLKFPEGAQGFSSNVKSVGYDYQPTTIYNYHSQTMVIGDTIRTKGSRIAYIGGAPQDAWQNAFHQLGYRVQELSAQDLLKISPQDPPSSMDKDSGTTAFLSDSLKKFDVIVWSTLPAAAVSDPKDIADLQLLMDTYIRQGGVVVNLSAENVLSRGLPFNDSIRQGPVFKKGDNIQFSLINQNALFHYPNQIKGDYFLKWEGLIALASQNADSSTDRFPLQIKYRDNNKKYFPISRQKRGEGFLVNCFLDLPSRLSAADPTAFKFLANLLAPANQKATTKTTK